MRRAILVLTLFLSFAVSAKAALLDEYQHEERFRLQNGEIFLLPSLTEEVDFLPLSGTADLARIRAILDKEDLAPVEVAPGRGLVQLWAIDWKKGDTGAFQAFGVLFLATEKPIPGTTPVANPRVALYPLFYRVNSEISLRSGIDVWGYPKKLSNISYKVDPAGTVRVTVREGGRIPVKTTCGGCMSLPRAKVRNDFLTVTPYSVRRGWNHVINEGDFGSRPFDPSKDEFKPDARTEIGAALKRMDFVPTEWTLGTGVQVVVFK